MVIISKKDNGGKSISKMEEFTAGIFEELGVKEKNLSAIIVWQVPMPIR